MTKKQDLRDLLRAAAIGGNAEFKKETVEIDGNTFVIKQPSIKARGQVMDKCTTIGPDGKSVFKMPVFMLMSVIECTYTPEGEKVFSEEDFDTLEAAPAGGVVDQLIGVATKMINVEVDSRKKPSQETQKNS